MAKRGLKTPRLVKEPTLTKKIKEIWFRWIWFKNNQCDLPLDTCRYWSFELNQQTRLFLRENTLTHLPHFQLIKLCDMVSDLSAAECKEFLKKIARDNPQIINK